MKEKKKKKKNMVNVQLTIDLKKRLEAQLETYIIYFNAINSFRFLHHLNQLI
jgi:hypothetical protein